MMRFCVFKIAHYSLFVYEYLAQSLAREIDCLRVRLEDFKEYLFLNMTE